MHAYCRTWMGNWAVVAYKVSAGKLSHGSTQVQQGIHKKLNYRFQCKARYLRIIGRPHIIDPEYRRGQQCKHNIQNGGAPHNKIYSSSITYASQQTNSCYTKEDVLRAHTEMKLCFYNNEVKHANHTIEEENSAR